MKNFIQTVIILCLVMVVFNQYRLETKMIVPVSVMSQDIDNPVKRQLDSIGIKHNEKLVNAICFASEQNNISPELIIALTWSESNFKQQATSYGNNGKYKGLMQIPYAVYYSDANILIGTRILREKISIARGDMTKAILLYKGYPPDSRKGHEQVQKVFALYHKLKTIV